MSEHLGPVGGNALSAGARARSALVEQIRRRAVEVRERVRDEGLCEATLGTNAERVETIRSAHDPDGLFEAAARRP